MIVLLAALSLTISQSSTEKPPADADRECWVDAGPGLAPINVEWPKGLPEAVKTDKGTLLPPALEQEIQRRLRCLWRWPLAAQAIIETEGEKYREKIRGRDEQIAALRNDLARVVPDPPKSWPSWALAVGGGVGIVLGGLATYGAIRLLGNK